MKFKIMEHEPIFLAGVVHYGPLSKAGYSDRPAGVDQDEEFTQSMNDLKSGAAQIKDQIVDEVHFNADHFSHDYREHRRRWKEEARKAREEGRRARDEGKAAREEGRQAREEVRRARSEAESTVNDDGHDSETRAYSGNFEGAIKRFGDVMESFGRHMQSNAKNWDENISKWGNSFEKNMETFGEKMEDFGEKMDSWGEDFGAKMEAWGEDFGKRMEEWGESFGEQWDRDFDESNLAAVIRSYPIYRTYEEVYNRYIGDHPDHIKRQTFYEVQIMDTSFEDVASMVMIGSRMSGLDNMRYPVATMTFEPDRWVAVKLTPEEYARDWMGSLEKVEQLKDYALEPYFIVRHRKSPESDEIRLFCPIKEKRDEG